MSPVVPKKIVETEPVEEKKVRVEEQNVETIKKEEFAVTAQPIEEPEKPAVKPGTAVLRSKALEELENSFKAEPEEKPKKKYKVVSIGDKK